MQKVKPEFGNVEQIRRVEAEGRLIAAREDPNPVILQSDEGDCPECGMEPQKGYEILPGFPGEGLFFCPSEDCGVVFRVSNI